MAITLIRPSFHQMFLSNAVLPTVPKLPTTNRLFSINKKRPSLAIIVLNRSGFGPRPGDIDKFHALGPTDKQRLSRYVEQQLDPSSIDDTAFEKRLETANFSTIYKSRDQLLAEHFPINNDYPFRTLALRELERLLFLRAIYSVRQLIEILSNFWHNHFNIYAWQSPQVAATFMAYDRHVIRVNLLGNYYHLEEAVTTSPEWQANLKFSGTTGHLSTRSADQAQHICTKLCRRLISDYPPASIVQSATSLFLAQASAKDQLKQVVRHILHSTEFQSTWGEKVKRPFETIVSALRATNVDFTIRNDDPASDSFMWRFSQIGQAPFACHEPEGYPDVKSYWQNSTSLIMRWRMINWLVDLKDEEGRYRLHIPAQSPRHLHPTPNNLVDYWITSILGYPMIAKDRQILINFLTHDDHPDAPIDLATKSVQERLRETVALLLNSPQFQLR